MILSEALHARANRVVFEYNSIVRRKACWAPSVILNEIEFYFSLLNNQMITYQLHRE